MHGTLVLLQNENKSIKSSKSTHAVSTPAVSLGHPGWNPTVCDKLLCRNKGQLTVYDDQLSVGWRWGSVEFSFSPIPIKSSPFPFPW